MRILRSAATMRVLLPISAVAAVGLPAVALAAPVLQEAPAQPSLWPVILAMTASAFGIERVVEFFWDFIEWLLLISRKWHAANLKTAHYLQFKSGASVLLSAILGVLLAGMFGMHLFAALQPMVPGFIATVPANWDVVMTGLIIGVLAKPIHELIEFLAELKNFMGSAAIHQREAAGASMAEGVLKLAQSDAQSMIEVPGMGPTRLATSYAMDDAETPAVDEKSPTDRYIDMLHDRTLM